MTILSRKYIYSAFDDSNASVGISQHALVFACMHTGFFLLNVQNREAPVHVLHLANSIPISPAE